MAIEKSELIAQDLWDMISEDDKVCVNCEHFSGQSEGGTDKCHGVLPCCNYSAKWEDNYFAPDQWYMQDRFGCEACVFFHGGSLSDECGSCRRYVEDKWVMRCE